MNGRQNCSVRGLGKARLRGARWLGGPHWTGAAPAMLEEGRWIVRIGASVSGVKGGVGAELDWRGRVQECGSMHGSKRARTGMRNDTPWRKSQVEGRARKRFDVSGTVHAEHVHLSN